MKKEPKNLNKFRKLLIIALAFSGYPAFSQTSVFQDVGGESAYKIFGNAVTVNAKDQSLGFSADIINRANMTNTRFNIWGFSAKATANEGVATFKNEKGFLVDGELGFYKAWKTTSAIPIPPGGRAFIHQRYISLNMIADRSKLFDLGNSPDKITYTKGHLGWKAELGWFGYIGNWIWGVGSNFGMKTNTGEIDQKTISFLEASRDNEAISVHTQETAFASSEFKGNVKYHNLNADLGYLLHPGGTGTGAFFLAYQFRMKAQEYEKPVLNQGVGIFLSRPGAPQDIVAGIGFQMIDIFNVRNTGNNTWQRTAINLTAGYKF